MKTKTLILAVAGLVVAVAASAGALGGGFASHTSKRIASIDAAVAEASK